jgi:hypothetical protein
MQSVGIFLKTNWQPILALATAIGAVLGYILTRKYELAWKRTEFVCAKLQYLDGDPDLLEMLKILEDRHPTVTINQIFSSNSKLNGVEQKDYQQRFDRLLDFLWQLCFAYLNLKTLSKHEIVVIGWHLNRVVQYPSLVNYCENHGFGRIITVAKKLGYSEEPEVDATPNT